MAGSIEVVTRILGLEPYILITINEVEGDEQSLDFGIDYGGGVTLDTPEDRAGFAEVLRVVADGIEEQGE